MFIKYERGMLTRADRDALPPVGARQELINGVLVISSSPGLAHQEVVMALSVQLRDATRGTELMSLHGPFDVVLAELTVVQPDLVIAPREQYTEADLPGAPSLIVEIRIPSTAVFDEVIKRDLYQEAGVPSYWLIDPQGPSITVLELVDGNYQEVARAQGDESIDVTAPVPMRLTPSQWRDD